METDVITQDRELLVKRVPKRLVIKCNPDEGKQIQREFDKAGIRVTGSDNLTTGEHIINLPWGSSVEPTQMEIIITTVNAVRRRYKQYEIHLGE